MSTGDFRLTKRKRHSPPRSHHLPGKKNRERLFKRLSTNSRMGQMERAKLCRGTMTLVIKRVKDASEASNQIWSADWPKEITSSLCVTELNGLGDAEAHPSNVALEKLVAIYSDTLSHTHFRRVEEKTDTLQCNNQLKSDEAQLYFLALDSRKSWKSTATYEQTWGKCTSVHLTISISFTLHKSL